jgi:uncharacterized repeat protein (TIGR03803 family)
MRRHVKSRFLLIVFAAIVGSFRLGAQVFTVLHNFGGPINGDTGGEDGSFPLANLILSIDTLYGVTMEGGTDGVGTIFSVNVGGSGYRVLHAFTGGRGGGNPQASLVLSGNILYGTGQGGGSSGGGTIFRLNVDGSGFTNIYNFSPATNIPGMFGVFNADGARPSGLTISGDTLYGTATGGGTGGGGIIFRINRDGTGFTVLHNFTSHSDLTPPYGNYDGASPQVDSLVLDGNTLYGTAQLGGAFGLGTVFAVNTDATGFRPLHSFGGGDGDGAGPLAGVILSGNVIYGTTRDGGTFGNGTIFKINTDGTGLTILHSFDGEHGAQPSGKLVLRRNLLYGTAGTGGNFRNGTVFQLNTNGGGFTTLHSFAVSSVDPGSSPPGLSTNLDGAYPYPGLVLSSNIIFGTAFIAGVSGNGTVFSLSFAPQLSIAQSGTGLVMTWPANNAGFDYSTYTLQSTTNLASPVWTANLPVPVVINGQYTVTNPISGTQQFFRLSQ